MRVKNDDTRNIVSNVVYSFGVKGLSLFIGLFTTPTYITYFHNNEILGVWFTLLSVLAWILNCDMGIGNGLRNKLVSAMKSDDPLEGRRYVSSSYIFSFLISTIIIILVAILSRIINWNHVFNISTDVVSASNLGQAITILIIAICLQLILRLITSILYALQKAFLPSFLNLVTNVFMLCFAKVAIMLGCNGSLVNMAYAYLFAVNIPLIIATIYVFKFSNTSICPHIKYFNKSYALSTLKMGGVFLWIQLMAMVLNSTSSYLVTIFFGNAAVVDFNIYFKIFTMIGTLVSLASAPIWSAATKAQVEKNYIWLYSIFKKFALLSGMGILCEFLLIPVVQIVFNFWLGDNSITVNYLNAIVFAIFGSAMIWSSTITGFVNGLGELKLQTILLTLGAAMYIPVTYLLGKIFDSYIAVCMSYILALLPYLVLQTIWLLKYFRKMSRQG